MNQETSLKHYGLTERFAALANEFPEWAAARVLTQEKGRYRIIAEQREKWAEVSGRFHYEAVSPSELPAVGDFVMVDWNEQGNAVIHRVLPRKSCFLRRAAGSARQEQVIAASIDTVFLCMALNHDFNLRRLERYLSIAWDSGAFPIIVLTKSDLCTALDARLAEVESVAFGVDTLVTTALEPSGYEQLRPFLIAGKTIAFIGSSGVGKSTMINGLLGEERLETSGLRNDDRGRHTTTRRECGNSVCGTTPLGWSRLLRRSMSWPPGVASGIVPTPVNLAARSDRHWSKAGYLKNDGCPIRN